MKTPEYIETLDKFAGLAMQAYLIDNSYIAALVQRDEDPVDMITKAAYGIAKHMVETRNELLGISDENT